ncbi:glycosyltransferase involved in cell wall biosynthesis [Mycetocola sp. BIGb0189]|uniref:glycosyltransferase family 4 protein n=1 Tax=Mycetocola sp. BIGb0189 TaxID=2940604 RepID=UPI00216A0819|nr:glycosyltransferase family 4 protein [Mycetocola sp. BIGb0189]MCS4277518.1 glycosyltransferase involved in cell wall biosynthesis [Mycetocola sp. BIGb0189]
MSKKILFIHPSDELYGADRVLLETLAALPKDWTLEAWLPSDLDYGDKLLSAALIEQGTRVRSMKLPVLRRAYITPLKLVRIAGWAISFFGKLAKNRPDLLYVNTTALFLAVPLARILRIPTVVHLHESLRGTEGRVIWSVISRANQIVAVSNAIVEDAPARARAKTRVIYNGFDLPPAQPRERHDKIQLLFASRWSGWKGVDVLIDAWDSVDTERFELTVLGGPPSSGVSIDVPNLVTQSSARSQINVVGEVHDVRRYIDAADVVIVPSIQPDPLPTIAIEAASAARATIATRTGGLPEIVAEGETGWLVVPGSADSLAAAINALDEESLTVAGDAAATRFADKFAVSRYHHEIAEVLEGWAK